MNCTVAKGVSALVVLATLGFVSSGCVTTQVDTTKPPPTSMVDKVGQSFKSGVDKTAELVGVKPKPHAAEDPDVIQVSATSDKPTPDLLVSLAQVHEQSGKLNDAEKQYRHALKLDANYLPALLGYARLQDRRGNFDDATRLYQKAIAAHPNNAAPYNDLGLSYQKRKMLTESAKLLRQAVRLEPQAKLYRNNLASVLVELGQINEALAQFAMVEGEAVAHYNVGYLLAQDGDPNGALGHFQQALRINPSLTAAQQWVARLAPSRPEGRPMLAAPAQGPVPVRFAAQTRPVAATPGPTVVALPPVNEIVVPAAATRAPLQPASEIENLPPDPEPLPKFLDGSAPPRDETPKAARTYKLQSPDAD
jgi:Tfp pilus assembly protein PilF